MSDVGDPLSDPRAACLLAAEPSEVGLLASMFGRVCIQASSAAQGLRGAQADATWTGQAADAFRHQLGKLPDDLEKVQRSYGEVASALSGYEAQLEPIQSDFRALTGQLTGARGSLSSAQTQLEAAQAKLSSASSAPHATSTSQAVIHAGGAVQGAAGAVGRLQGEVSGLERRGYQLLDEFDQVRGRARSTVSGAAGIAPSQSWLSGALSAVGNFMSGAGHVLLDIGKGVIDAAASLPSDIATVFEHPLDLHDWSKLAEDVGTVAGAVALVAAVLVCPADAVGLEGAAAFFEATDGAASTVGLVAAADKTEFDAGLAAEGNRSWGAVAFDAAGLASSQLHLPGVQAARDDQTLLAAKSDALEQYGLSRALGASHQQAYSDLTDAQRLVLTKSAAKLSDAGRLSYMRSSTGEALAAAEVHLHRLDALDESAHFVFDKTNTSVKKAVVGDS